MKKPPGALRVNEKLLCPNGAPGPPLDSLGLSLGFGPRKIQRNQKTLSLRDNQEPRNTAPRFVKIKPLIEAMTVM